MFYLPNSHDPIPALPAGRPTPSPQGEGRPAAQATAVASVVAFSPSPPAKAKRRTGRGSQPCRLGRLEGVYDISHMVGFESK